LKAQFFFEDSDVFFTDNLWMGIMPLDEDWYWWNGGQGGQWWRSHWLGLHYREAPVGWEEYDYRVFPTEWMYHLWLGWIYPAEANSESVWIWQAQSESWLWTNKEIFPILYHDATGLWGTTHRHR